MGLLDSLKMLGSSIFSSKEEKAAWIIQYYQIAAEKPHRKHDDIIKLMQTQEATKLRKEFVKNNSPAEIEAFLNKLLATIELANEGLNDETDDLTQSEHDYLMEELEIDRKYWAKEEANATAEVLSRIGALQKSLQQEDAENDDPLLERVPGTEKQEIYNENKKEKVERSSEEAKLINQRIKEDIDQIYEEEENDNREYEQEVKIAELNNKIIRDPEAMRIYQEMESVAKNIIQLIKSENTDFNLTNKTFVESYKKMIECYRLGKIYKNYIKAAKEKNEEDEAYISDAEFEKLYMDETFKKIYPRIFIDPDEFFKLVKEETEQEFVETMLAGVAEESRRKSLREQVIKFTMLHNEYKKITNEQNWKNKPEKVLKAEEILKELVLLKDGISFKSPQFTKKRLEYYFNNFRKDKR